VGRFWGREPVSSIGYAPPVNRTEDVDAYMAKLDHPLTAEVQVHLVWHNGVVLEDPAGLLEGSYPDRRMTYFVSMADVEAKGPAFEALVRQWVELMDREG
jgi:hypothetical protein